MPRRVCPVYKEVRDLGPALKLQTANTGLVYDRYADIWSGPGGQWTPDQPKRGKAVKQQFLDEIVTHAAEARQGIAPWLQSFQERREKLWAATGATVVKLKPAAPLISGIGIAHPLEVGFVWDRNLGVPYLPATTLKGAAHAWARQWLGMPEDTRKRIFGDSSDDGGAGSVVFHSLYPLACPRLRTDVLNPHFGDYYQSNHVPGDWLEPKPTFFLTVHDPEVVFCTAIHARRYASKDDVAEKDVATAGQCLLDALAELGVGAKTAVGYGVFSLHVDAKRPDQTTDSLPAQGNASASVATLQEPGTEHPSDAHGNADHAPTSSPPGVSDVSVPPVTREADATVPAPTASTAHAPASASPAVDVAALTARVNAMDDAATKQLLGNIAVNCLDIWEQPGYRRSPAEDALINSWLKRIDRIAERTLDPNLKQRSWVRRLRDLRSRR